MITFRPVMLALTFPEHSDYHILIVDNDAAGSARATVSAKAETTAGERAVQLHYHIEPQQGLSNARNALLEQAKARACDRLTMLDDDEHPDRQWLKVHLLALQRHQALVSTGPVVSIARDNIRRLPAHHK